MRDTIAAVGARFRFLPAYGPTSLRSILRHAQDEVAFAKLEALLPTAAPRTIPDRRAEVRTAIACLAPQEGRNDLVAAEYENDFAIATRAQNSCSDGSAENDPDNSMTQRLGSPSRVQ